MKCLACQKPINAGKYCNNKCQGELRSKTVLENWLNGSDPGYKINYALKTPVRIYLLEKAEYACTKCGWNKINPITGKSPLEIDHIDGDCTNAKEENLKVLCPNCHSLTPTWKSLNKGKGNRKCLEYAKLI